MRLTPTPVRATSAVPEDPVGDRGGFSLRRGGGLDNHIVRGMERITATQASRNFSNILNRARYGGESFLVERNGEAVAEIRPASKGSTVADAIDVLKTTTLPGPNFKRDMLETIAERKRDYPRDPWSDV